MAKVIGPLHSAEARGRMAGLIFNTWRGMSYVKAFCSPAQPRTARQLQIRAFTVAIVRAWQALSGANRAAWNTYAVNHPETDWTGNPKRLTGLNWFVRCTLRLFDLGEAQVDTAPAVAAPDAPGNFVATGGVLSAVLTWTPAPGTDLQIDFWYVGPHSAGILQKIERATHHWYLAAEGDTENTGPLLVGTYTFFARIISEVNGLASTWMSDTAVITAA